MEQLITQWVKDLTVDTVVFVLLVMTLWYFVKSVILQLMYSKEDYISISASVMVNAVTSAAVGILLLIAIMLP